MRWQLINESIKKARLPGQTQIFAVKFIHKAYAMRHGRVTPKQLDLEITLHKYLGHHANIVQFFQSGEDSSWRWIAMELAEGGDLFDKIESDVGVGVDIAHVYFVQLVSAVAFMHSKGVGHRDIKPENILLSMEGNLKIADFGLATLYQHHGQRKISKSSCGSPPYTAPEVVNKQSSGYYGDLVDIWSCGVVLFVLLVGNTPWDEPSDTSYEFHQYLTTSGIPPDDELWQRLEKLDHGQPEGSGVIPLLRGMMSVEQGSRYSLATVQLHPWFRRTNPHLRNDGKLSNPVALATEMFESMHIDFSQDPLASQRSGVSSSSDVMDVDTPSQAYGAYSNGLETPRAEIQFDWETSLPRSQPANAHLVKSTPQPSQSLEDHLADEPFCSQFAPQPAVPLSRTQFARRFADILPSHSMTRFFSHCDLPDLLPLLINSLKRLEIPVSEDIAGGAEGEATFIKLRTRDERKCSLIGELVIERVRAENGNGIGAQVCFVKVSGDPVQWRRLFKKVVQLCQHAVWKPE